MRKHAPKILAVFVGLGPLVGLVAFSVCMSIFGVDPSGSAGGIERVSSALHVLVISLVIGLFFAHLMGAPWALIAALCAIAITSLWRRRAPWIGPVSGVVSFAAAMAIGSNPSVDLNRPSEVALTLLLHVIAATTSWIIACRWIDHVEQRETQDPPSPNPARDPAGP